MLDSRDPRAVALRRARHGLIEHGELPPAAAVGEVVARSWGRSHRAGLEPVGRLADPQHLDASALARSRDRQHELIAHARPVMEYLHAQTRDSGSMVILADARGVLLDALGDADFLDRAGRVALAPGASWDETQRGTNAIGTALVEAAPVVINGGEHYLERNGFLTCAAAPVSAPDGRLLGVLDISGDSRNHHPHTFCLVRTAAQMLENRLFDVRHAGAMRLRFHALAEGIGTLAEGVLAVSGDGVLVGANRIAFATLRLGPADLGCLTPEQALGVDLAELLEWARRHGGAPLLAPAPRAGGRLYVRVEARFAHRLAPASSVPARVDDALAGLDAGCPRLAALVQRARRVLDKPIPVLLGGESGVGKEVFAQAMHASSARRAAPFVAVDCSALPEHLIEAELFGYAPGAYTGARRGGAPGRIREADGGTLFLDEIGDMPLALQSRLLRVLQQREVQPLGGGRPVAVDFALIAASHRDLAAAVDAGTFRADLYYRLNGLSLALPALRERGDFGALVRRLLDDFAPGRGVALEARLLAAFADFAWPGNVRQLANVLRTACALLDDDETLIGWPHLPDDLAAALRRPTAVAVAPPVAVAATDNLRDLSEAAFDRAIEAARGNLSEAARRLGISRNTLYRRLKRRRRDG